MKLVRVAHNGGVRFGSLEEDGTARLLYGADFTALEKTEEFVSDPILLAPLVPPVIFGIGLNYRFHAEEQGAKLPQHPVVFFKNPSSVVGPNQPIVLPSHLKSFKVDYECELAVVIGKEAKNVSKADAWDYVFGITAANDVSARDWQKEWGGGQWSRAKSFDTFCPLGPCIVTLDEFEDPQNLRIKTLFNDEYLQDWTTSDMIFDVPTLIEFLSGDTTLVPGTVILTGTPHGVGMARTPQRWLSDGDLVTIELEGVGRLVNPVKG